MREKAIETQPYLDFSPLMVKYNIYDQGDVRNFMSKIGILEKITIPIETQEDKLKEAYELISKMEWLCGCPVELFSDCITSKVHHEGLCITVRAEKWLEENKNG